MEVTLVVKRIHMAHYGARRDACTLGVPAHAPPLTITITPSQYHTVASLHYHTAYHTAYDHPRSHRSPSLSAACLPISNFLIAGETHKMRPWALRLSTNAPEHAISARAGCWELEAPPA